MTNHLLGKSIPRKEGRKKVTGAALYVDDIKFDGMLHGVTVRSSIARGRIKSISFEQPQATAATNGPDQPPAMLRTLTQPLPEGEGKEAGDRDRSDQPLRTLPQPLPEGEE